MTYPSQHQSRPARRLRGGILAGALALSLALTGCSQSQEPTGDSSSRPVSADDLVSTTAGEYRQSSIDSTDPAWKLPEELTGADVRAKYTAGEIEDAYRFILTFTASEGIDSALNGEAVSVEDWWDEHQEIFHPDNREEILDALKQDRSVVQREIWQERDFTGYSYIYDGSPRVTERTITPEAVWLAQDGSIAVRMGVSYTMNVTPGIGDSGTGRQMTDGYMTYSARPDADGNWSLTSYLHNLNTYPG